jgi:hypothetical protein
VVDHEPLPAILAPRLRVASPGASTLTTYGKDTAITLRTALLPKVSLRVLRKASEKRGRQDGTGCQDILMFKRIHAALGAMLGMSREFRVGSVVAAAGMHFVIRTLFELSFYPSTLLVPNRDVAQDVCVA